MLGLIAGTSLRKSAMFRDLAPRTEETPYGTVTLGEQPAGGAALPLLFCQRHDRDGEFVPPHNVNYHGNLMALKQAGATAIVGVYSVGGLHVRFGPGTVVVPDDYLCPWNPATYSERGDDCQFITPMLDRDLREHVIALASGAGADRLVSGGVYIQTRGPRFETRAEVRMLARMGDVVGMTGAAEATLAQELGIPFAMICMVDNHAHGVTASPLTLEGFHAAVESNRATTERLVQRIVEGQATR